MVLASVGGLALAGVAIAVALLQGTGRPAELVVPPTSYPAAIVERDVLGSASAPVVMELYADFQCPACRTFVTKHLGRLVSDFVVPGTLRIEARDIAFLGRGSPDESLELAAGARCAAEQGRYWAYHDYVFWNQGRENRGDHNAVFIEAVAGAAGLELDAFRACLAEPGLRPAIKSATSAAAAAGIQSTPTIVVNGMRVVGVPVYDQLAGLIQQAAGAATEAPVTAQ